MNCDGPNCQRPVSRDPAIFCGDPGGAEYFYCCELCQTHHFYLRHISRAAIDVARDWFWALPPELLSNLADRIPAEEAVLLALYA